MYDKVWTARQVLLIDRPSCRSNSRYRYRHFWCYLRLPSSTTTRRRLPRTGRKTTGDKTVSSSSQERNVWARRWSSGPGRAQSSSPTRVSGCQRMMTGSGVGGCSDRCSVTWAWCVTSRPGRPAVAPGVVRAGTT